MAWDSLELEGKIFKRTELNLSLILIVSVTISFTHQLNNKYLQQFYLSLAIFLKTIWLSLEFLPAHQGLKRT